MKKLIFLIVLFLVSCQPAIPEQIYQVKCTDQSGVYYQNNVYWDKGYHGTVFYHLIEVETGYLISLPISKCKLTERD